MSFCKNKDPLISSPKSYSNYEVIFKCINISLKQDVREAHAYFFPEQKCDPVTVLISINLTLLLRKSCSVHMAVLEMVIHRKS